MMTRRGFLGAILATATAPAIVRADSLMRIVPRGAVVLDPYFDSVVRYAEYGFGTSDFTIEVWMNFDHINEVRITSAARYLETSTPRHQFIQRRRGTITVSADDPARAPLLEMLRSSVRQLP